MYSNGYYYNTNQLLTNTTNYGTWMIVSILVALCAGIVIYFTFLNERNAETYTGATKKIYNFLSFKVMTLEGILKMLYLITAIYITIFSFSFISTNFITFLVVLLIGNILTRVCFESALLVLMIYRRLGNIKDCLTKEEPKKEPKEVKETKSEKKEK